MSRALVDLNGVCKRFPRVHRRADRLRSLGRILLGRAPVDPVSVLEKIDLQVYAGQSLGLIGENGAGKSTLLKLISGVLAPTDGQVTVRGKIGALLELGAGFHPEYTGRENLRLAGTLMGLDGRQLAERTDDILAFADIGSYIDEPIKHYSSGMVVRLAFAIIASTRPELLITDEVLAVGDESFQKKCIRWIEEYLESGGTLLLVSHSMYHIQRLCKRACWLRHGRVEKIGEVFEVTQAYLAWHEERSAQSEQPAKIQGLGYQTVNFQINGKGGDALLDMGQDLDLSAELYSPDGRAPQVAFGLVRADGTAVYGVTSEMDGVAPEALGASHFAYRLRLPALSLLPGRYHVRAHAMDPEALRMFDTVAHTLTIRGSSRELGLVRLCHAWL